MTKLEELKMAYEAADVAADAAYAAYEESYEDVVDAARDAYEAELKKIQQENSDD